MKRIFLSLLALAFVFSASGCTSENEKNGKAVTEKEESVIAEKTENAAVSEDPLTIAQEQEAVSDPETEEAQNAEDSNDSADIPNDDNSAEDSKETTNVQDGDDNAEEKTEKFTFTTDNYPRMGGSLANLPLGEAVTATVLGVDRKTASSMVRFEGSTTDNYKALVDGAFDIIIAYEIGDEAVAYCEEKGVELEMTPIGTDALVFICSLENKVNNLSSKQIEEIYKGNITNWSKVGGANHPIIAYQRNKDSGSQTLFDKIINLGDELMEAPLHTRIESMIGLLEAVADYDNSKDALGYTVYYYLTNMEQEKLSRSKLLSINGVAPSNETIASGEYPYVSDFYVVIRKDAGKNSPERILYNWIKSEQGKELARRENYVVK